MIIGFTDELLMSVAVKVPKKTLHNPIYESSVVFDAEY
jgi:hypothetical protein